MNYIYRGITTEIDNWAITKWNAVTFIFWDWLDAAALLSVASCMFLGMFGLEAPKRWATWTFALYLLAKFFQYAL